MLRNADGGGEGVTFSGKKRYEGVKVQRYYRYEGVGGGPISWEKVLRNTLNGPYTVSDENLAAVLR